MECCHNHTFPNNVFKCGNKGNTNVRDATPYSASPNSTCTSKQVNTIRICQSFANHLWVPHETEQYLKTGEDLCGFSIWSGAKDPNFASDEAGSIPYPNPNG